jgi:hypothetical protein
MLSSDHLPVILYSTIVIVIVFVHYDSHIYKFGVRLTKSDGVNAEATCYICSL